MTDIEAGGSQYERYLARQRAGETKKRRTREKLMNAADYSLREYGFDATVEKIAEEAGVSTATFYSFYHSRNELCVDAFISVVVEPLEQAGVEKLPFFEAADALVRRCDDRRNLVRCALLGRLEAQASSAAPPMRLSKTFMGTGHLAVAEDADFIYRLARLLADDSILADGYIEPDTLLALPMATLRLLDSIAMGDHLVNTITLTKATYRACRAD